MPQARQQAGTIGDAEMLEQARRGNANAQPPESGNTVEDGAEVLGLEDYTWTAPDGFCSLTFRRAPGGTAARIARVLGPAQCQNAVLNRMYRALASIATFNGEKLRTPQTDAQFRALMQRFGPDGYYDENFETYCVAWEVAMNPELIDALTEAEGAGLSPEDIDRIAKNAGLSHTKKSPRRGTSEKS